jgi:hypothetical protein
MVKRSCVFVLAAIICCGCEPEPRYLDQPLSVWIRRTNDRDVEVRKAAVVALASMNSAKADKRLREMARMQTDAVSTLAASAPGVPADYSIPHFESWVMGRTVGWSSDIEARMTGLTSAQKIALLQLLIDTPNATLPVGIEEEIVDYLTPAEAKSLFDRVLARNANVFEYNKQQLKLKLAARSKQ